VITPRDGLHGHLVIVKFLFFILFEMTFNNGVASLTLGDLVNYLGSYSRIM
jgi:hypothetical protein